MIQTPPTTSAKKWTFETAILQLEYRLQSDHLATLEAAVKEYQEGDPAWDFVRNLNKQIDTLTAENKRLRNGYNDLIMTVERKCPGESRYETAKRYINEREAIADCDSAKEALK